MVMGTYHWRNSYRFITGFEFLRDYLKRMDLNLISNWGTYIANSPWNGHLARWQDIERRMKNESLFWEIT